MDGVGPPDLKGSLQLGLLFGVSPLTNRDLYLVVGRWWVGEFLDQILATFNFLEVALKLFEHFFRFSWNI